jgi:hypothetical protein
MEGEDKKNEESKKSSSVTLTLSRIPRRVHNKLKEYRKKVNHEKNKDLNLKEAYVEFLKEMTK